MIGRHPFITAAVLAVTGAGLLVLAIALVVNLVLVPAGRNMNQLPAQLGHAYSVYWNGVGQQFRQACEAAHGPDCQQYGGPP